MRDEAPPVRDHRAAASKRYRAYCRREGRRIYAQGTFATKADAGRGTSVDPHRGHEPLQPYAGTWVTRTGADSARGTYEGPLRLRILPTFGKVELAGPTGAPSMVRTWCC